MGSDLSEPSSRPYPDRSGWVIAAGAVEILMGLGCLLLAAAVVFTSLNPAHVQQARVQPSVVGVVLTVGTYLLLAACFLVAGIGSVRRRNWARIMMLTGSGIWLAFGVFSDLLVLFLVPKIMAALPSSSHQAQHLIFAVMIAAGIFAGILLPSAFLLFYTRKSVKATFLSRRATAAGEPPRVESKSAAFPIPLVVPVVFEALGVTTVFYILVLPALLAFGFIIHGWKAVVIALAYSVFSGIAAWLIYKKSVAGWNIAFVKALLGVSSMLVTFLTTNLSELITRVGWNPQQARLFLIFPGFIKSMAVMSTALIVVYVIFLAYTRKFFVATVSASTMDL